MPVTMYDAGTGQPVQVAEAEAAKAFASGALGFAPGQEVHFKNQEGQVFKIGADQAGNAFQNGMQLAGQEDIDAALTRQKESGIGRSLAAAGAGAARGLTLGLSDPLAIEGARAFGGDEAAEKTRAELNALKGHKFASGAGEVGGMLLPLAFSGGTAAGVEGAEASGGILSGAARAAGALPRGVAAAGEAVTHGVAGLVGEGATSLLGRVAQRAIPLAAGAAVEGAAYGAGQTISEAALGNEELTAEKLLAGAGHGALIGGLVGGGIGVAGELGKYSLEKIAEKAGKGTLRDSIEAFADKQTLKATGALGSDIKKLGRTAEESAERIHDVAQEVRGYRFEDGTRLLKAGDTAETLAPKLQQALDDTSSKLGKLREKFDEVIAQKPELAPDMGQFFRNVDERFAPQLASPIRSVRKEAQKALDEIAQLPELAAKGPVSFKDAFDIRRSLDKAIFDKGRALKNTEGLQAIRGMLEDTLEASADKAAAATGDAALAGQYQATKATFRNLKQAADISGAEVLRDVGRRFTSPSDYGVGAAGAVLSAASGHGGLASAVGGGLLSVAHKFVRERSSSVLALGADALADLGRLKAVANRVDGKIASGVEGFIKGGAKTADALRSGAEELAGKTAAAATAATVISIGKSSHSAVQQQIQHVAQLANDPKLMAEHTHALMGNIATAAPRVATAVAQKDQQRIQYLASVAPAPSSAQSILTPQLDTLRYKDADVNRWLRTKALVYNPTLLVDELNRGTINKQDVDAVKATSPKLYEQILDHVKDKLTDPDVKIPYNKRVRLGTLFGFPADQTQTPEFAQFIGNTYAGMAKEDSGSPGAAPAGGVPKSRNVQPDMGMIQSATQRVEGGAEL